MNRFIVICILALVGPALNSLDAQTIYSDSDTPALRLQSRFIAGIELCVAPSYTKNGTNLTPAVINFKAGYKLNSTYMSGLLGIEYLNGENFLPLGIEIKQSFSDKKWAPIAYVQTGYSLHLKRNINSRYNTANYSQYDPSFFARAGFGYSYVSSLSEFYFSLGYLYHQLEEIAVEQEGEIRTDLTMHGVSLTVGIVF